MADHTAESIKSLEGFDTAWAEEAQTISARSLELLRPTIRAPGSELWFSWNPRRPEDPVDRMFRGPAVPTGSTIVRCNWSDNPWFPPELEQERKDCLAHDPDRYPHIWEGGYVRAFEGAYYAKALEEAEQQGRIGGAAADPILPLRCYWDIGGTSAKSDATAIWVCQFVADQIRVLDYYEAVGQPFSEHIGWLRRNGYGEANQILPHDGAAHDKVFRVTPRGMLDESGFPVEVIPNGGEGAVYHRIDTVRRVLPRCVFHRERTAPGRDALGWYHAKRDAERRLDLGPVHDWSSHGADAFGLMAVDWQERAGLRVDDWGKPLRRNIRGIA